MDAENSNGREVSGFAGKAKPQCTDRIHFCRRDVLESAAVSTPKLTFTIEGSDDDKGRVAIDDFARFCENIARCLRRIEGIVSDDGTGGIRYRVANLKCGSATVTLEAVRTRTRGPDKRREVVRLFRDTCTGIQDGNIDPRVTMDDLQAFRELGEPLQRGAKTIRIAGRVLRPSYMTNIDNFLTQYFPSEGFVSGILEKLNVHNKFEFALYPPVSGRQITCVFHRDQLDVVRSAIKRQVTVHGTLFFQPDNPFPDKVQVKEIQIHPSNDELPTLHDVQKLGKWGIGEQSAVEFVRAIRSE